MAHKFKIGDRVRFVANGTRRGWTADEFHGRKGTLAAPATGLGQDYWRVNLDKPNRGYGNWCNIDDAYLDPIELTPFHQSFNDYIEAELGQ